MPKQLVIKRTRHLGGLIYFFTGLSNVTDFATFYREASTEKINGLLENLFLKICFSFSRDEAESQPSFNFSGFYTERLGIKQGTIRDALAALIKPKYNLNWINGAKSDLIFGEKIVLPNPVEFILNNPIIGETYLAIIHGDLSPFNILVDHHREAWLIDFVSTGRGPWLTDFARLEVLIKFLLLSHYEPYALFEIEKELANSDNLISFQFPQDKFMNESLFKMYTTVCKIRQLAFQVAGENSLIEYFTALLFNSITIITTLNVTSPQRISALLSAALICKRLKELIAPQEILSRSGN